MSLLSLNLSLLNCLSSSYFTSTPPLHPSELYTVNTTMTIIHTFVHHIHICECHMDSETEFQLSFRSYTNRVEVTNGCVAHLRNLTCTLAFWNRSCLCTCIYLPSIHSDCQQHLFPSCWNSLSTSKDSVTHHSTQYIHTYIHDFSISYSKYDIETFKCWQRTLLWYHGRTRYASLSYSYICFQGRWLHSCVAWSVAAEDMHLHGNTLSMCHTDRDWSI